MVLTGRGWMACRNVCEVGVSGDAETDAIGGYARNHRDGVHPEDIHRELLRVSEYYDMRQRHAGNYGARQHIQRCEIMKIPVITNDNYLNPVRTYFTVEELHIFLILLDDGAFAPMNHADTADSEQEAGPTWKRSAEGYLELSGRIHGILETECGEETDSKMEAAFRDAENNLRMQNTIEGMNHGRTPATGETDDARDAA